MSLLDKLKALFGGGSATGDSHAGHDHSHAGHDHSHDHGEHDHDHADEPTGESGENRLT